ncbi:MAG: HNH endonuclease [Planctomycetota bacterium]|nr:HNH endonuclease [Planctomycetota bacterium]MDP7247993.1 HNH endonuclease [Planctomycetota bacterium]
MARISDDLYELVAQDAQRQCGYCRSPQTVLPYRLEIEHLNPVSLGGGDERENLWLCCHKCNNLRSNLMEFADPISNSSVPIFNPRIDAWHEHFRWEDNGHLIVGLTARGRATVATLRLNDEFHVAARDAWITTGLYPPE